MPTQGKKGRTGLPLAHPSWMHRPQEEPGEGRPLAPGLLPLAPSVPPYSLFFPALRLQPPRAFPLREVNLRPEAKLPAWAGTVQGEPVFGSSEALPPGDDSWTRGLRQVPRVKSASPSLKRYTPGNFGAIESAPHYIEEEEGV